MNKYDFKLQNVLNFKSSMETQMVSNYNSAKKSLEKAEGVLIEYTRLKKKLEEDKNNLSMSGKIKELKLYNQYINQIKNQIKEQKKQIENEEINVKLAKENLIEASKDKKIYEKLKHNDYKDHLEKMKKKEAIVIDEIVTFINSNN